MKGDLDQSLADIRSHAFLDGGNSMVLFAFMNSIVVRLNQDLEKLNSSGREELAFGRKSTLRHASEKAIESYFPPLSLAPVRGYRQ